MEKFDGLSSLVGRLSTELQRLVSEADYERASHAAKELVGIFAVLEKHKILDSTGPIVAVDIDNIKPKVVSCLQQIAKDDGSRKLFTQTSVHVELSTALFGIV